MDCLHRGHGLVRHLRVPILRDKLFGTCHRSQSKRLSIDKPIPSSVSRGHDAVQRETRRQRVWRHMRVHTVAELSNIQQKVHRISFRLCAVFVTSVRSKEAFSMQWDVRVCIRRPSCLRCGQASPEYIAECERNNRVRTMEHDLHW